MSINAAELEKWFCARPQWLQDAARRLFQEGSVSEDAFKELLVLCKREAGIAVEGYDDLKAQPIPAAAFHLSTATASMKLNAVSEIEGINALAPRKALEFGNAPLVIVYGANGSGKSGYTRVLKHACGGRGLSALHGDVFAEDSKNKSCKISYRHGEDDKDLHWTPSVGVHGELRNVALYDSDSALVYVNNENELTYEPRLLSYFSVLVKLCEKLDSVIAKQIAALPANKPALPSGYAETEGGIWFSKLNWQTSEGDINSKCAWNETLEDELSQLNKRLAETNPIEKAKTLRKTKAHLSSFLVLLKDIAGRLSDEAFGSLTELRSDAEKKSKAAREDAKKVFDNPPLEGIPSDSWRLLWEQARLYSEKEAYKGEPFPVVGEDALCVLCQQPLGEQAKQRLNDFEKFVKGKLEAQAQATEKLLEDSIHAIKEVPANAELDAKLDLGGVADEVTRESARLYCEDLAKRRASFLAAATVDDLPTMPSAEMILTLSEHVEKYEKEAQAFDEDSKSDKKDELTKKKLELGVQKWLSEQRQGISAEVKRLKAIYLLSKAQRLANTKALSSKKSTLAEVLVTKAFKDRFDAELVELGASRVKVTIEKTKAPKGHVFHQIKLKGNKSGIKAGEILSEGEFRIVSLAVFLADVGGNDNSTPFIFDDPISSLDIDFEELTAARLVKLSKSRQVIVFTHRLSLLSMLEDAAKKATLDSRVVSVQRESWGAGEPNDPPLPAQKPKKALNTLFDHRLPKARKVWSEEGNAPYQVEAKALCSDIRITVERLIENDLLADVVQRFRRPINTIGKIDKLARINITDCTFLEKMMTKYSRYEHSQPNEAPVPLPEPDEIDEDLCLLKAWLKEFSGRVVAPE